MAFGHSAMCLENRKKFYHTISLTESWILQISKFDFETVVKEVEKKLVNEKVIFLKTIPEFGSTSLSRTKLVNLCKVMTPLSMIKNQILYKENDPLQFVYFVKSGELKISKKIILPQNDEEAEEVLENPNLLSKNKRVKSVANNHVVGLVSAGNMLGVEETCLGTRQNCYT